MYCADLSQAVTRIIRILVRTLAGPEADVGLSGPCESYPKRSARLGPWREARSELYVYAFASCASTENGTVIGTTVRHIRLSRFLRSQLCLLLSGLSGRQALAVGLYDPYPILDQE